MSVMAAMKHLLRGEAVLDGNASDALLQEPLDLVETDIPRRALAESSTVNEADHQ